MTDHIVTVIGAGGVTGRPLLRALLNRGVHVRVITRTQLSSGRFPAQIEAIGADLADSQSLAKAFQGSTAVHYIPPSFEPREPEFAAHVIAAAKLASVPRLVYHSVLHPCTPEMPHHLRKSLVEHQLRHSSLVWTIIQPAMYAQTALAFFDAEAGELIPAFDPTKLFAPIHEGDLAEAAAIIHVGEGHDFATYELAGSEVLNFIDMADRLSLVVGRSVNTRQISADALVQRVAEARGYSPAQAMELRLMLEHYDGYGLVGNGKVLRMVLGREPTVFVDAMRQSLMLEQET